MLSFFSQNNLITMKTTRRYKTYSALEAVECVLFAIFYYEQRVIMFLTTIFTFFNHYKPQSYLLELLLLDDLLLLVDVFFFPCTIKSSLSLLVFNKH